MIGKLRIAGWVLFIGGMGAFLALGGPGGFQDNEEPLWNWVTFFVGVSGVALTSLASLLTAVRSMRRRRGTESPDDSVPTPPP